MEQGYIYNFGNNNPGPAGASARRLMESWATGVEIYLTNMRYRRLGPNDYQDTNLQNRKIDNGGGVVKFYTTTFYDMYDHFNQRDEYGIEVPIDRVSGLSWKNMEKSLIGTTRWDECREKNVAISGQSNKIRELFNNW